MAVTTKFPINGAIASCFAGSLFHFMLKYSGYDHVVIGGRSEKPIYLKIQDDTVEFCDATDIWGKTDNYQTVDILRSRHEPCSVIPIGPAGEKLVPISATMVDKTGHLGSGGLPAVMGSKNLKAIVAVQGTKSIEIADRSRFMSILNGIVKRIEESRFRQYIQREDWAGFGVQHTPAKYIDYADFKRFSEEAKKDIVQRHSKLKQAIACVGCPSSCKARLRFTDGRLAGKKAYACHFHFDHEFEFKNGLDLHDHCAEYDDAICRYGLCKFHFSDIVSVGVYLFERGLLTKKDTGGIELKENFETYMTLMRMVAHREGFGDFLANGIVAACQKLGLNPEEYVLHTKNRFFIYDPRISNLGTAELNQILDPRGGNIREALTPTGMPSSSPDVFMASGRKIGMPVEDLKRIIGNGPVDVGRLTKYAQDWGSLFNCLGMCLLIPVEPFYDLKTLADLYSSLTGIEMDPASLMRAGERTFNLYKLLNIREGYKRTHDDPPELWFKPLKDQDGKEHPIHDYLGNALTREDVNKVIDSYYDERGWDKTTGLQKPEKLRELGLEGVAP